MTGMYASFALVLMSCGAGDDTADGSRAECAHGGALTACPEAERTPEGACWRLVDCAAIPVKSADTGQNRFDWGRCVNRIETAHDTGRRLMIDCIAASSCDQLQGQGSPNNPQPDQMPCFMLGAE